MIDQFLQGDAASVLRGLPGGFADCAVTSPPYWGLRNYGTPPVAWGGDHGHAHRWRPRRYYRACGGAAGSSGEAFATAGRANAARLRAARWREDAVCDCGAWRGHLGLEPDPQEYAAHLVAVFREVRRALRSGGTLWLNLGDSWASTGGHTRPGINTARAGRRNVNGQLTLKGAVPVGLKPKDLVGVPWLVAFALRADGWHLREEIIWSKPNAMPESVTDRCTRAHEQLFHLSAGPRYYHDAAAISEPADRKNHRASPSSRRDGTRGHTDQGFMDGRYYERRNKRSVWTVTTKPFRGAHFATFPVDLAAPCVLAGSRRGGVVLDPFMGAGTTAVAARACGRRFVGVELSPRYVRIARKRLGRG